ncbi:glycosyltransferase family 2 protein [Vibrio rumoiensis]|uniref:Acyltransferase n=1 Tax=Vibrio rumoiensis 1S-45 TaxID=1188252 RepID=A0A1E5E204_9VIBR|nr:glycosyltransferase family 2 protein [Vibrio rumoiensis]OEF25449.1 acyltransferase [Vibrio rumoiensis 1S-45]
MTDFNPCFVIPCYNHGSTMAAVIDSLLPFGYPIFVVDDGSNATTKAELAQLESIESLTLITLGINQGKGGAMISGLRHAHLQGFSHAIQIDADGQHDIAAIPQLIEGARQYPKRLISGRPIYDESVPKARFYGRYATHVWVWIETLSLEIQDSMCGFRAYPLQATIDTLNQYDIGKRMDFDTEIMVKMYWQGCRFHFIKTNVFYPEGGISHFDALHDNIRISKMHTKLFFGMLPRIPKLIARHFSTQPSAESEPQSSGQHWAKSKERGTVLGIKLLMMVYALLGRPVFNLILKLVISYYYRTGKSVRQASEQFLKQIQEYAIQQNISLDHSSTLPLSSYQHLLSFGKTMLDKLAGWRGDIKINDLTIHGQPHFDHVIGNKQGIVILGSHLGNLELCRALGRVRSKVTINALVFTEHAERFNRVMKAVNPDSSINLIQVNTLGPDTAILLQQKLEQGEWVVIVGDRTSTTKEHRVVWADFLGKPAPFPQGPFMLATVLAAPVYLLFGLRDDSNSNKRPRYDVYFEPFSEQIILPRKQRMEALQAVVQQYAHRLEHFTMKAPLQWYNFFNFWQLSETESVSNAPDNSNNSSKQDDNSESK